MITQKRAFTLPELMVVVLIMAVLMAVAVPLWNRSKQRAEAKTCRATLQLIDSAKKEWALDNPDNASNNSYNNGAGTGAIPTVADLNPYIDGGFNSLQPCPEDTSEPPTPTTSYNINTINTDPDCARANMTNGLNCPLGPDGTDDNGQNDDHKLN